MKKPIYLDHHATTPLDPRVLQKMMPYLTEHYGNAASRTHQYGWIAEEAVEQARIRIATAIGASKDEIVFTSGATEANNLAIKGIAETFQRKGRHIITVSTEHASVLDTCEYLREAGFEITVLEVSEDGILDQIKILNAIRSDTILVSVMLANNETGVIQDMAAISTITREKGIILHTDAVQALGKIPVHVENLNVDLLSLSAHKFYGPKGVGALYIRKRNPRIQLTALLHGGGHENGRRSGTLNVPGIVGMGEAARFSVDELQQNQKHYAGLRERLWSGLKQTIKGVRLNGPDFEKDDNFSRRLPNNLNVSIPDIDGEGLIMALKDIAVSTGSACSSAVPEPSHVLLRMGISKELAKASLRFGLGSGNTSDDIDYTIKRITETVGKLIKTI